ncbi:hypothetical protein DPMN_046546 [Dreissena polymorpha]|uniref:Uncharacterized protein n=1 Tax=Dreissena polymorpha TaxID=45954 RepID=A0A9D4I2B2_DREPO|nr:hypothetical protein DPMN_046546 [Dreissena polymorpha]
MNSHALETTPPFYELIPLLSAKANKFTLTLVMVAEGSRGETKGQTTAQLLSDVSSTVEPIQ